jgi:hypothetical protein
MYPTVQTLMNAALRSHTECPEGRSKRFCGVSFAKRFAGPANRFSAAGTGPAPQGAAWFARRFPPCGHPGGALKDAGLQDPATRFRSYNYACACFFMKASARFFISWGATSSTWVAIHQKLPAGSLTPALRSP